MSGGPIPIRSESHQAPSRGCITTSGGLQVRRSDDRDSEIPGDEVAKPDVGRWKRIQLPPTRSGSSAAFLSSGATTTPIRSTDLKSPVVARKTAGPAGPYAVHVITNRPSSSTQTTRASSKPHCSSSWPLRAARSGSGATCQPSTPFADRATCRCERPVRASTRASSTVSPPTSTAAGLKTTFTACGQSAAVRIGFAG